MTKPAQQTSALKPFADAFDKNVAVQDVVAQSASELLVINAVLKQEIPDYVQTGEVAQALKKTEELENKIHDTVEDLAEVNKALAKEIDERVALEHELVAAKAELAATKQRPV